MGIMKTGTKSEEMDTTKLFFATTINDEQLAELMSYHPWDGAQVSCGERVRAALGQAVKAIIENVPPCDDRSVAIRKIREARMDANSAITFRGRL